MKTINVQIADIIKYTKQSLQIPEIMEAVAHRQMIINQAEKLVIKVELDELQAAADNLRIANKLYKADDTWSWLRKYQLSLDDLEEIAYHKLLSQKLANYLFADKVESYFYENQLDYTGAAIYEIIIDDEDVAMELFYGLQAGEISFQEVARQYIQEPEIRRAGGYRGIRYRQDFLPEVSAAIFASNPPQLIKPIVTPKGVHLIWVEEIIKPELNDNLRMIIMTDMLSNWLKQELIDVEVMALLDMETPAPDSPGCISSV